MSFEAYMIVMEIRDVCEKYGIAEEKINPFVRELIPLFEKLQKVD